jgi:hypothetical protein
MSKPWTPNRPTVELRTGSKIRREPPPPASEKLTILPADPENEAWAVIIGVVAFAIAFNFLIFWISDYTSPAKEPQAITIVDAS